MAAIATRTKIWSDQATVMAIGTIALTGNYAAGGIALNFLDIVASGPGIMPLPGVSKQPLTVRISGIAGYIYEYNFTTMKVIIRESLAVAAAAPLAEIPTAVLPAGVTGDTIQFEVRFPKV